MRTQASPPTTVKSDAHGNAFELRRIDCPLCGPTREKSVGMRGGKYHRYGLGIETEIVECDRCGLMYPNPFPFPLDFQRLYADPGKYFDNHDTVARTEEFRKTARRIVDEKGADCRLLDVGSGRGEMIAAARQEGIATVVGLEPSEAIAEEASIIHDAKLLPLTIEEYASKHGDKFDAITLNAVLEHVQDPASMIRTCAALLDPGGILYLDIPNESHLLAQVVRSANRIRRSPAVIQLSPTFPPYHVFGFNPRSIRYLLDAFDFAIDDIEIFARFDIPSTSRPLDRLKARAAMALQGIANRTSTAHNMFIWARKI